MLTETVALNASLSTQTSWLELDEGTGEIDWVPWVQFGAGAEFSY
ncbi:MAG: hypothetical protein AAFV53_18745 [Myxococcota bacterium]